MFILAILLAATALAVSGIVALSRTTAPYRRMAPLSGAFLGVWCPRTTRIQRIRVGPRAEARGASVLECEIFPAGELECDGPCIRSFVDGWGAANSFDVRHALVFPSSN
jgi:hypothetical protein